MVGRGARSCRLSEEGEEGAVSESMKELGNEGIIECLYV